MPEVNLRAAIRAVTAAVMEKGVKMTQDPHRFYFLHDNDRLSVVIAGESHQQFRERENEPVVPVDILLHAPYKVANLALTRLGLNQRIFARNCEVIRLSKVEGRKFLGHNHMLNDGGGAYYLGLTNEKQGLVAVASFSKGRAMDRLPADKRSFELVRFCTKAGYSVSGGLSRLVTSFCRMKGAGDVMTYVDRQLSDGASFTKAGFRQTGETPPESFLIDRKTFVRHRFRGTHDWSESRQFLITNKGSIKFVFTCPDCGSSPP